MTNQLFQTSVVLLSAILTGFIFWGAVKWYRNKYKNKKTENQIEDLKKNTWLEKKKARGYGRQRLYLVTLKENKKVYRRISQFEFDAYKEIGIQTKGHAANSHAKRVQKVEIR